MSQAHFYAEDLRFDSERRVISKGSALVKFKYLRWYDSRTPDPTHVEVLKKIFQEYGCRPLEVKNHIPAIVDRQQLETALEDARQKRRWRTNVLPASHESIGSQEGYPELGFLEGIEYIHGCHRIQAGREYLTAIEQWWIVDLYLSDITYELKTYLADEYANEEKLPDGLIYRKIREYNRLSKEIGCMVSSDTCHSMEMRWRARLKGNRAKNLIGVEGNSRLTAAFDTLSQFPGICDGGMTLTTLNTLMAMRCPDWAGNYLKLIETAWDGFVKGISGVRSRIDKTTVKAVELRAPGVSTLDAKHLYGLILGGAIFSNFNREEREIIWNNIKEFKGLIPSLFTFFQDIKFLKLCTDAVKYLVTIFERKTLLTTLEGCFKLKNQQFSQATAKRVQSSAFSYSLPLLSATINIFLRHLSKKNRLTTPKAVADTEVLQQFATLAGQLEFESPEIDALQKHQSPNIIQTAPTIAPLLVTTGPGVSIKDRCGIPHIESFENDKRYLFLDNLFDERVESGEGITSFFVLKSWFTAFFRPQGWKILGARAENLNQLPSPVYLPINEDMDIDAGHAVVHQEQDQDIDQTQRTNILTEQERETSYLAQEEVSKLAAEANRRLELEQETQARTIIREVTTQQQIVERSDPITLYFVEANSDKDDMLGPIEEYKSVHELRVDFGDPSSCVELEVGEYLRKGKRICDRFDDLFVQDEMLDVVYAMTHPERHKIHETGAQELAMDALQDSERGSRIIYLKTRMDNSHDFTKPVEEYRWIDMEPVKVLLNDPQKALEQKVREIWNSAHLLPHTRNNKTLKPEECYDAIDNGDRTLYFVMPSPQTEMEKESEHALFLPLPESPPPLRDLPPDHFRKFLNTRRVFQKR